MATLPTSPICISRVGFPGTYGLSLVVHVIYSADYEVTVQGRLSMFTVATPVLNTPVNVTDSPPRSEPKRGVILVNYEVASAE